MCGIVGVFGRGDSDAVRSMLETIIHRGPDDGFLVGGEDFALGARRLSIVDLAGGRQPLANETGTIWAAQNGELYNFLVVRPRLLERGHQLRTTCDTEILPHLYEDYGVDFVTHIDGMFAVAVWDDEDRLGVLARDRMGKKPLYYYQDGEALYFASEVKALLRVPGFERRINFTALHHYLSYKHVPHPLSIFEGVSILPPAHRLVFRPGNDPVIERYWELSFATPPEIAKLDEEEIVDEVLRLLRQGVQRRLMSDVPIGFFLSGGIDSSLSAVLAAEIADTRIKTFTLTYGGASTTVGKEQDRRWASYIADRYDTEHHEEVIEFAHFPDSVGHILTFFDEPFAGVVSTFFLSQLIARHVKVAVSGDGADELFGSYRSHRLAFPLANFETYRRNGNFDLLRPFENELAYLARMYEPDDWAWRYKLLVLSDEEKLALYTPDIAAQLRPHSTYDHLRGYFTNLTATDSLNRVLEAEFRAIFPDQVMTFTDRLSMAHSLEVRTAYLDTDFVTFVASLPGHWKIHNGETKYILKKAAGRYFPQEMAFRPKEGFLMPVTEWILGDLEAYVRETLSPARLNTHGIFNPERVQALVDGLYQGRQDYTYVNKVLGLVIFQEWYELYMV